MRRRIAVLDAPSNLGLRPPQPGRQPGVRHLPNSLRAHGLLQRLQAHEAGEIKPPDYSAAPDHQTGFRNGAKIAAYSIALSQRVAALIQTGHFPLVLGGDCSILLGNMLALRRLGEYGLCFLDGHQDFAFPRTTSYLGSYAAAGLDLALATGRGPEALTNLLGLRPYVDEANVVALGFYDDPADAPDYQTEALYLTRIQTIDIDALRELGPGRAALGRERLKPRPEGLLDSPRCGCARPIVMPAVDSPNREAWATGDLIAVLRELFSPIAPREWKSPSSTGARSGRPHTAEFVGAITQSFG
jgi:arginase